MKRHWTQDILGGRNYIRVPLKIALRAVRNEIWFGLVLAHGAYLEARKGRAGTFQVQIWYTWDGERHMCRKSNRSFKVAVREAYAELGMFFRSKRQQERARKLQYHRTPINNICVVLKNPKHLALPMAYGAVLKEMRAENGVFFFLLSYNWEGHLRTYRVFDRVYATGVRHAFQGVASFLSDRKAQAQYKVGVVRTRSCDNMRTIRPRKHRRVSQPSSL